MNKITIGLKVSPDLKDWLQHLADTYAKEHQNVDLKDVTLRKPKK
jgi:hypothetical protein